MTEDMTGDAPKHD